MRCRQNRCYWAGWICGQVTGHAVAQRLTSRQRDDLLQQFIPGNAGTIADTFPVQPHGNCSA